MKGGGRLPKGHGNLAPGEEDYFALFDVKNYPHKPLDRGYLIGPQVPISSQPLCVRYGLRKLILKLENIILHITYYSLVKMV